MDGGDSNLIQISMETHGAGVPGWMERGEAAVVEVRWTVLILYLKKELLTKEVYIICEE